MYMYIYIYTYTVFITKGSLLAGYLEFYFAKQRGGLDPLSLNDQEKGTPPPHPPLKGNSRHMPCASLHAAAPSQCLIISIIVIILIIIIIILLLITIIIRLAIRIFRFSKYPTVR